MTEALDRQGGLYTRVAREGGAVDRRVIDAIRSTARVRRLADPAVHVVALTRPEAAASEGTT